MHNAGKHYFIPLFSCWLVIVSCHVCLRFCFSKLKFILYHLNFSHLVYRTHSLYLDEIRKQFVVWWSHVTSFTHPLIHKHRGSSQSGDRGYVPYHSKCYTGPRHKNGRRYVLSRGRRWFEPCPNRSWTVAERQMAAGWLARWPPTGVAAKGPRNGKPLAPRSTPASH